MKKRSPDLYFVDIISAIGDIEKYIGKKAKSQFLKDVKTQDAVIRKLEVIGEAVKHLPVSFKEKHTSMKWSNISGMRNILAHEYFGVDAELVWKTAKEDLRELLKVVMDV